MELTGAASGCSGTFLACQHIRLLGKKISSTCRPSSFCTNNKFSNPFSGSSWTFSLRKQAVWSPSVGRVPMWSSVELLECPECPEFLNVVKLFSVVVHDQVVEVQLKCKRNPAAWTAWELNSFCRKKKLASTADAFSRISFLTFFTLVCAADVYGKKNFKEPWP